MTFFRGKGWPHVDPRQLAADQNLSFEATLDRLRSERSGMAFIYAAIDLFVARFELVDAVIVLHDGHEGTQIFRSGGKSISPDRTSLINAPPGVYFEPPIVNDEEVRVLFERCRREFDDLRSVGDASTGVFSPRRFRVPRSDEPIPVAQEYFTSPVIAEVEDRQVAGSKFGIETWRVFASRVFVFATIVNLVLALTNVTGVVRFVSGLALGLAIPGWSIVGLFHFRDTALEIALSMAASIAIVIVSAQFLITVHFWHLEAYEVFLCVVCLPSLVRQSKWRISEVRSRR